MFLNHGVYKNLFVQPHLYESFQVNINGDISFGELWSSPFPQPFPQPVPIIAPFWADFDFRCEDVFYRQTTSNSIRAKVASDIQSHLSLQNAFDPTLVVIATWNETSYYGASYCGDKVITPQEFTPVQVFNCTHVWRLF